MDLKWSISLKNFFEGINELISVNFTSDFKTEEKIMAKITEE